MQTDLLFSLKRSDITNKLQKECICFLFNDKPGMSREHHKSPAEGPHCMHIKYYLAVGRLILKSQPFHYLQKYEQEHTLK